MPVGYHELPPLLPVAGVRWACLSAGIKKSGRLDVSVMEIADGATVAGVFTRNVFCAAPVQLARQHLSSAMPRLFLINTGNANAGTGAQGLQDANRCCQSLAEIYGCQASEVLPFSTGVIGEPLPTAKILTVLPAVRAALTDSWQDAARAIMTTDTVPKGVSTTVTLGGQQVTITGIVKGAGMIRPDMATLLAFVATDAGLEQSALQNLLSEICTLSFNSITVDGDTSTNDSLMLVATGRSGVTLAPASEDFARLRQALLELCQRLAQLVIRDAEGATKFITITINGGRDSEECRQAAFTIAHSPLVKTAFFASDPNWGRILAALGRAGLQDLELEKLRIFLDDVCIVSGGGRDPAYTEAQGQAVMDQEEITIRVELDRGGASHTIWTSDFSHEYVRINAEYRT